MVYNNKFIFRAISKFDPFFFFCFVFFHFHTFFPLRKVYCDALNVFVIKMTDSAIDRSGCALLPHVPAGLGDAGEGKLGTGIDVVSIKTLITR